MDVLQEFILPLFEQIPVKGPLKKNSLIQTGLNEYSIYVDLEDVYKKCTQSHLIPVHHKRVEYQIPIWYHQIVLSNKGHHFNDLIIQIKTLKHDTFLRVNSHDLLVHQCIPILDFKNDLKVSFEHLDGEIIEISIDEKLKLLQGKGLPKPDGTRGNLYVLLVVKLDENDNEDIQEKLLDIINYNSHSNVIV